MGLREIIKEALEKVISEQEYKKTLITNIKRQFKILDQMKRAYSSVKMPSEFRNVAMFAQKYRTTEFLKQVLDVDDTITVRLSSILENPEELYQALIDEIYTQAQKKASMKLNEANLPDLFAKSQSDYAEKRQKKQAKKKKKLPDYVDEASELEEGADPDVAAAHKKGKKAQARFSKALDRGNREEAKKAQAMMNKYFDLAKKLAKEKGLSLPE